MIMEHGFIDSMALRLVLALLNFLWQGCAVWLVAVAAGRMLKRASANSRYLLNVAAMFVMMLCLPLTFVLLDSSSRDEDRSVSKASVGPETTVGGVSRPDGTGDLKNPAGQDSAGASTASLVGRSSKLTLQPLLMVLPFAPYVMAAYFLGVALMILRLAMAMRGCRRLCRSAIPVEEEWLLTMIVRESHRMGLKVVPLVVTCERISVPIVVGILKPMILLPCALASGLSPDQVQILLAHELAHIRRFDLIVNLFQRLAETVLFFHPAAWYISNRMSLERELAADDAVIAGGWHKVQYATALVRMAELSLAIRRNPTVETGAFLAAGGSGSSELKRRVLRMIDDDRPIPRLNRAGAILFFASLVLVALTPVLVHAWDRSSSSEQAANSPVVEGPSSSRLLAQAKPGQGKTTNNAPANSFHPHIVIAQHVILWDHHVATWDQVVKRLRARRAAGPFRATFHFTYEAARSPREREYHDRIMNLYRELFEPVGVSFAGVSYRGSGIYDAIRTDEDALPDPKLARTGQVLTPDGKPAHDAQVIVLPIEGPRTVSEVALSGTQLRDPFDEQWTTSDERGEYAAYPKEKSYRLMVLHPSGFATQPSTSTEKVIRLTPWATVSFDNTGDVKDQQATISARPDGTGRDEPKVMIHSVEAKGQPIEIKVPAGDISVSRSLRMEQGVSIGLPAESFSLKPGESRAMTLKPPSDADRKRARALFEERNGPKAMQIPIRSRR